MKLFPPHLIDFYKSGHIFQYPQGTEYVYSNFTPRSFRYASYVGDKPEGVVFFGLQGIIKWFLIDLWNQEFFSQPLDTVIEKYSSRMNKALGEGAVTVHHIKALHQLGYLPIHIKALPEGSLVNFKVPVLTIINTEPEFFWLTNYLETALSAELWKVSSNATIAYEYYKLIKKYAVETGAPLDFIRWQCHDFSARGMSGVYDASQSGTGHLLSFMGTDTVSAIDYLEEYYHGKETFIGGSVPATEHSVMTMDSPEDEVKTFKRLITKIYPKGIISIVSDTRDFFQVVTRYASFLKEDILNRQEDENGNCRVVFRPDSGDPVRILTGYTCYESEDPLEKINEKLLKIYKNKGIISFETVKINGRYYFLNGFTQRYGVELGEEVAEAEVKGAVQCLWDIFGGTENEAGFRFLNSKVGLIYGDSITLNIANEILERLKIKGFGSTNVLLGIGSFTYQLSTRDTYGWAMKATWAQVKGKGIDMFKDPKTDDGVKKSLKGLIRVEKTDSGFVAFDEQTSGQECEGCLESVFMNGTLLKDESLKTIRERLGAL